MKQTSYKKAKDKAWEAFSQFTRLRDCLKTTGSFYHGRCVTCGRLHSLGDLHAGHFLDGRHNAVLFDERGCHAQCYSCNMHLHGNKVEYTLWMQKEYGQEVIEELRRLNNTDRKYKVWELEEIREKYLQKVKEFCEGIS